MPPEYLLKDDSWVSDRFAHQWVEQLIKKTGDKEIARNAGRMIVSPDTLGPIEYELLQSLGSIFLVFRRFPSEMKWTNRVSRFQTLQLKPGYFRFKVEPVDQKLKPSPHVCENLLGALEGGGRLFEADFMIVNEATCIHRGASHCEFEARYSTASNFRRRGLQALMFAGVGWLGHSILPFFLSMHSKLAITVAFWTAYVAGFVSILAIRSNFKIRENINQYHDQSHTRARELEGSYRKLDRRYNELNVLNELSLSLVNVADTRDIVDSCLDSLSKRFQYGRCLVMLLNDSADRLKTYRFRGFPNVASKIADFSVSYDSKLNKPGLFADILARGEVQTVFNVDEFRARLKPENQSLIDMLQISSLICCPLQYEQEKFGLMVVGSAFGDPRLTQDDVHLVQQLARVLSIHFKTIKTVENERNAKNLFQKYVPQQVLDSLNVSGAGAAGSLQSKTAHIASLFVDLRNFTRTVEHLSPERVLDLLNRYSDFVTSRIAEFGGIIDKLVGDEVVGFFMPSSQGTSNPENAALKSALKICGELEILNAELREAGLPQMSMGLGLHSGSAVVGNTGSKLRLNYTALGDTVNLASRLQALTKDYFEHQKTPKAVLITTEVVQRLAGISLPFQRISAVPIRGRDRREDICVLEFGGNTAKTPQALVGESS